MSSIVPLTPFVCDLIRDNDQLDADQWRPGLHSVWYVWFDTIINSASDNIDWHKTEMSVQNLKLIFSHGNERVKPKAQSRAEISNRLSRSMER